MYSIIRCQNSQYKVKSGDKIVVDKINYDVGEKFSSNQVMMVAGEGEIKIGNPYLAGASYTAKVEKKFKDKKITVFKKKRRHNYRRKKGHRQELCELTIVDIKF